MSRPTKRTNQPRPCYLSREMLAQGLMVSTSTIRRFERSGYLTAVMVGTRPRYSLDQVLRLWPSFNRLGN
jgi:hypothetical protein